MFKLVISDDEGKTTVVPLVRDEITIGRKEGNTIRLTERNVSRRHARLQRANGAYVLEDLSSYNGVRINGQRIGDATALKAGDQVAIGDYLIALQSEEVAAVPPPAPEKPPPARLVMLTPPAPGAEFALHDGAQRIGRAEDLDIWVNHRSISREHAEVTAHEDGILSIRDLSSANGMRVNGEDRTEAEIEPGDVVELGQVRFRYVGAGEKYAFEADRTVAMDAVVLPDATPPSKAPVYVALAIVLLAVAVGAGIALQGGDDDPIAQPIDPTPNVATDPDPTVDSDREATLAALTDRCATLVREGDYQGALNAATDALRVSPLSSFASMCREQANQGLEASRAFNEGVRLWNEGDASDAWAHIKDINNPAFIDREEYDQIRQAYLTATLDRAENNPRDAEEYLREVDRAAVPSEDEDYLARAAEIRRGGSQIAVRPHNGGMMVRNPPYMRPDMSTQVVNMNPSMVTEMAARESAAAIAQGCRFDSACIIRGIGSPRNADDYAQLVEAHRSGRNVAAKRRVIQQFLARYPSDTRAVRYQRELQ